MEDRAALKALEQLNLERIYYYESKDYINMLRVRKIINSFPKRILSIIKDHMRNKKIRNRVKRISDPVSRELVEYADPIPEGLTGVAYTCITNGYDVPKEPLYKDPNLTYVLYTETDDFRKTKTVWNQHSIMRIDNTKGSNYLNRYYKLHPFDFFYDKYDYSLYIDGNVQLISDTSTLFSVARDSKLGIAMHRHAYMNCAYKNALWCELNHRGNNKAIQSQIHRYQSEGFPKDFGLLEATIMVVDLHNDLARSIMNNWWEEFEKSNGGRDQIALPYILWKMGYKIDDIGCLGNDEYHNPKFRISAHLGIPV